MVRILGLLTLLLAFTAQAAVAPSGVPQINRGYGVNAAIASKTIDKNATSMGATIALTASVAGSTSGNYLKFVKLGTLTTSAEQYQVTAGKTLQCDGYFLSMSTAAYHAFGYGTAALGSENGSSAPTGEKVMSGAANAGIYMTTTAANVPQWMPIPVSFPASSYPFLKMNTSSANINVILLCEEI